jgi:hypothetical protein
MIRQDWASLTPAGTFSFIYARKCGLGVIREVRINRLQRRLVAVIATQYLMKKPEPSWWLSLQLSSQLAEGTRCIVCVVIPPGTIPKFLLKRALVPCLPGYFA